MVVIFTEADEALPGSRPQMDGLNLAKHHRMGPLFDQRLDAANKADIGVRQHRETCGRRGALAGRATIHTLDIAGKGAGPVLMPGCEDIHANAEVLQKLVVHEGNAIDAIRHHTGLVSTAWIKRLFRCLFEVGPMDITLPDFVASLLQ